MEYRKTGAFSPLGVARILWLLGVLSLSCSPNEVVIPPSGPPPPPLPIKDRIFFVSNIENPGGALHVFSMKPDGSDIMQVTHPDTNSRGWITSYTSVSISPNLYQLAFAWEWGNVYDDYFTLTITDTSLANLDQWIDWCYAGTAWSPNGSMVSYSVPWGPFAPAHDMYVVPAAGGLSTKITSFVHNTSVDTGAVPLQWIAGSTILVRVTVDTPSIGLSHHVCEMELDGRITRWILSDSLNWYTAAKLSPRGDMLAYIYRPVGPPTTGIGVATPDGENKQEILSELDLQLDGISYHRILWSPDGDRIAVSTERWILTVNPDGSEIDTVLATSGSLWVELCDWK